MSRKNLICERLKEAQDYSLMRFEELKHKKWDWLSFNAGVIEYWAYTERKRVEDRKKYRKIK
jgi:hypothetical protein